MGRYRVNNRRNIYKGKTTKLADETGTTEASGGSNQEVAVRPVVKVQSAL